MDPRIRTYTGRMVDPFNITEKDVCLEDIAHSLANQCRYMGHSRRFYSIAEHSVLVSGLCGAKDALWGLLHDASEAYTLDVPKPMKHRIRIMPAYGSPTMFFESWERRVQNAIADRFGLPWFMSEAVHNADHIALVEYENYGKLPGMDPLTPVEAEDLFIKTYYELYDASIDNR